MRRAVPALTEGTELVGEFTGSGYRVPPQLVHRFDGQVIHLPPILYEAVRLLAQQEAGTGGTADGAAVVTEVAERLSESTGRQFTAEHVVYLIDKKLAPLGVTSYSDGSPPEIPKAKTFLDLRFRKAVVSERATWFISGLFAWLFRPAVLVLVVGAVLLSEVWVFTTQNIGGAVAGSMARPDSVLVVLLLTLASSVFHEFGHAAACRYGKVRPGVMGCGIYLVWPAFYTDVTNSYRLSRAGRLRTDLGGVYFNGIFLLGLIALHHYTGSPVLLAAILFTNLEMVQQLLPTLRFDGYYIVSDLVGIPDLFKYIGPILRRSVLRKPADERLNALKRWPQFVVTVWVLTVLPAIAVQLGIVVSRLPDWTDAAWTAVGNLAGSALDGNPVTGVLSAILQIGLVLLPLVGVVLILWQLAGGLLGLLLRKLLGPEGVARLRERLPARRRVVFWTTVGAAACAVFVLAFSLASRTGESPAASDRPAGPTGPPAASEPTPKERPSPRERSETDPPSPSQQPSLSADDRSGAGNGTARGSNPAGTDRGGETKSVPNAPAEDEENTRPPRERSAQDRSPGAGQNSGPPGSGGRSEEDGGRCTTLLDLPLGPLLCG